MVRMLSCLILAAALFIVPSLSPASAQERPQKLVVGLAR